MNDQDLQLQTEMDDVQSSIQLAQSSNLDLTHTVTQLPCQTNHVRSPEVMQLKLTKPEGIYAGKLMSYHPRWNISSESITCDIPNTTSTERNLFFDFTSDTLASKVAHYVIPTSSSTFWNSSTQNTFGLPSICSAYDCPSSVNLGNNMCFQDSLLNIAWFSNCSGESFDVSNASFTNFDNWPDPSTFLLQSLELPDTL